MIEPISIPILISGPSVSSLEVEYASDAAKNGWNSKCFDYITKFEKKVCEYLGVKYALATSSCTGALHLSMLSLGIGEEDEVILPESTWVATANAVEYVGATPIFVDVEKDSWTISIKSIKKAVTPKTKAIIVTHLYGHPCNMQEINTFAKEHNIYVVEDSAQCMGGELNGIKTGNLSDIGCFSFHGSKAIVMGEGGIFTTNNQQIYERAKFLGDQGKHPTKRFFNIEIGYKYKLSNLQAAFGLAQMERVDEIIAKKRQIFGWYKERLCDIPDITLNSEKYGAKNTYWMPTIVLGDSYNMDAFQFAEELLKRKIESRPFFYPLSCLPMYNQNLSKENPNAYYLLNRAVNLPCGPERLEEEIDYICANIKDILIPNFKINYNLWGWLKFRENYLSNIKNYTDLQLDNLDFKRKSCEIKVDKDSFFNKNSIDDLKKVLKMEKIFARVRSIDKELCETLHSIGFKEIQRVPFKQHNISGNNYELEIIKTPFEEVDFYLITFAKE